MQIITTELREQSRLDLNAAIPLPQPLSLYIEPTSLCNMRCQFCPTGHKDLRGLRPNGLMKLAIFDKIVEDLKAFPKPLKRVNLYKDGEPLINPALPAMIRGLRAANVTEEIWIKTNGLLLKPKLNEELIDAGLDMIGVSIQHVNSEGYQKVALTKLDYDNLVYSVADLYARRKNCKIYVKIADSGLTEAELAKFFDDFCDIADYCAVERLHGWSASDKADFQLGTKPDTFEGYPLVDKVACPLSFFMLAVNWNGTVSPCNEDWLHAEILGDVTKQSLKQIWQSKRLFDFRMMHLEGRRAGSQVCGNCHYLTTLPDNIDGNRKELIERLTFERWG